MSGLRVVAIFNAFIISSAFIACQRVQITIIEYEVGGVLVELVKFCVLIIHFCDLL